MFWIKQMSTTFTSLNKQQLFILFFFTVCSLAPGVVDGRYKNKNTRLTSDQTRSAASTVPAFWRQGPDVEVLKLNYLILPPPSHLPCPALFFFFYYLLIRAELDPESLLSSPVELNAVANHVFLFYWNANGFLNWKDSRRSKKKRVDFNKIAFCLQIQFQRE